MFGKITGGRKFKAFLLIFAASCIALGFGVVTADHFERLMYFCGGFYAGANVIKAAVDMIGERWRGKDEQG
jgi:hypothetical protein